MSELAECHGPWPTATRPHLLVLASENIILPHTQVNKDKKKPERHDAPALPLAYTLPEAVVAPLGCPLGSSPRGRCAARFRPLPLPPRALRPPRLPPCPPPRPCGCGLPPWLRAA